MIYKLHFINIGTGFDAEYRFDSYVECLNHLTALMERRIPDREPVRWAIYCNDVLYLASQ